MGLQAYILLANRARRCSGAYCAAFSKLGTPDDYKSSFHEIPEIFHESEKEYKMAHARPHFQSAP